MCTGPPNIALQYQASEVFSELLGGKIIKKKKNYMAPNGSGGTHQLNPEEHQDNSHIKVTNPATNTSSATQADTVERIPLNLRTEGDRRKTFDTWTIPFMDSNRLAAAGFYYLKRDDVVRCVFCGVEIGCWEEGDDPFRDHQRWSPGCPYMRKLPVGNVPVDPNCPPIVPISESSQGYDTCGRYGIEIRPNSGPDRGSGSVDEQSTSLEKLGIHKSRGPAFSKYNSLEARLKSFESWPLSLKQRPDKLSEAGFYYTGKGDQTVCFHCGGGLKDWEEADDPWIEHALWFSKCTYMLLIKGKEFVEQVCKEKEAIVAAKDVKNMKVPSDLEGVVNMTNQESASTSTGSSDTKSKVVDDARLCKICYIEELGVLFLPCGHIVACVKCAPSLTTCAVCRKPFSATVRAFLS